MKIALKVISDEMEGFGSRLKKLEAVQKDLQTDVKLAVTTPGNTNITEEERRSDQGQQKLPQGRTVKHSETESRSPATGQSRRNHDLDPHPPQRSNAHNRPRTYASVVARGKDGLSQTTVWQDRQDRQKPAHVQNETKQLDYRPQAANLNSKLMYDEDLLDRTTFTGLDTHIKSMCEFFFLASLTLVRKH